MSSQKDLDPGRLPPGANAAYPDVLESESDPALGRRAGYLRQERIASGNLDDDPTDSGEPVRNKRPFAGTGGR